MVLWDSPDRPRLGAHGWKVYFASQAATVASYIATFNNAKLRAFFGLENPRVSIRFSI